GGDPCRATGLLRAGQLADQTVAVPAVDRPHVLDDLPVGRPGRTLEEKGRGMQRNTERSGPPLVRHGGLDRLVSAHDYDSEALLQQLVERVLLEIARRQARDE